MAGTRRARGKETTLSQELAALLAGTVVPSLRKRVEGSEAVRAMLRAMLEGERAAGLTADDELAFRERFIEQIGASWVLATVFVRFLEDRGWIAQRRIAGPGAEDSEELFGQAFEGLAGDAREYLLAVFRECGRLPGAREVLGPSALAALKLSPDAAAARAIVDFWREVEPFTDERGVAGTRLRWRFDSDDTRVLGDLYQDLSESVRERYALLQTPDFVERFILQYTLVPAMAERGVDGLRVLDPTCGSGHFLLGAFEMIRGERQQRYPAESAKESAQRALACVHGVDLNPYAVAITRFRLLVAYARAVGLVRLREVERDLGLEQRVVVADSLIPFGKQQTLIDTMDDNALREEWGGRGARLDDVGATRAVFKQRYHVVVGNPPYITCKDAAQRDTIREAFPKSAYRSFALGAPFTERFFQLAEVDGYVGMINANSFMKREFGRPLIEDVLRHLDLTHVVDTSGAYIPGHGTPTVVLFARNRRPERDTVRAVLGKRGEPSTPARAEEGQVWTSITSLIETAGGESEFVSIADVSRATFGKHPWSLGGGGAGELKELIEQRCEKRLGDAVDAIGYSVVTGDDDALMSSKHALIRRGIMPAHVKRNVAGEEVRDWLIGAGDSCIWSNTETGERLSAVDVIDVRTALWPLRSTLRDRKAFGQPVEKKGIPWWSLREVYAARMLTPLCLTFAEVATHNHFAFDRGGRVFKQTAPIIKLAADATEDDHLALLAWLNSSVACFWMKQVAYPKGMHNGSKANATPFLQRFAFDGTKLSKLPIPAGLLGEARLAALAKAVVCALEDRQSKTFATAIVRATSRAQLDRELEVLARDREACRNRAIAFQEEIDWVCYSLTVDKSLRTLEPEQLAPLAPGERPFEIALGADDPVSVSDGWFKWNEYSPAVSVPERLPATQRATYDERIEVLRDNGLVRMLEGPIFKRRWVQPSGKAAQELESDEKVLREQGDAWIAEQVEDVVKNLGAAIFTETDVRRAVLQRPTLVVALEWQAARLGLDVNQCVAKALAEDAVPFLATLRFTASGWEKHLAWKRCWELQRAEDRGETVGAIEVPPKYEQSDYKRPQFWSLRGTLDVPRERYIAYPFYETSADSSPRYGWAGWDHRERIGALAELYERREDVAREVNAALLAGMLELHPWIEQWHNALEGDSDQPLAEVYAAYIANEARHHGWLPADLVEWGLTLNPARDAEPKKRPPQKPKKNSKREVSAPPEEATSKPRRRKAG